MTTPPPSRGPRRLVVTGVLAAVLVAGGTAIGLQAAGNGHHATAPEDQVSTTHDMGRGPLGEEAFMDMMIPHHRLAIRMAEIALANLAKHPDWRLKDMAFDIKVGQTYEISRMEKWRREWFGATSDVPDHEMSEEEMAAMGMHVSFEELEKATPFAPAFYDAMIPHHQTALVMARRVLAGKPRPLLAALARSILGGQAREIARMRRFRAIALGQSATPTPPPAPPGGPVTP